MPIHNPIAIQKDGVIFLRYCEYPRPESGRDKLYDARNTTVKSQIYHEDLHKRFEEWQPSFKEVPFKDQEQAKVEAIKCIGFEDLNSGIPLDSIADRIKILCDGCGRDLFVPLGLNKKGEPYLACCPDNKYFAIIKPEEDQESQIDLAKAMQNRFEHGENWSEVLQYFEIRRRK